MNLNYKEKGYMTAKEFSKLLGISYSKVIYWDEKGVLLPVVRTPGGRRYYNRNSLVEALFLLKEEGYNIKRGK